MANDEIYMQGLNESLEFWKTRVDADDDVLTALHRDHYDNMMKAIALSMDDDLDALMSHLSAALLDAQADWNVHPVKKTKEHIQKLSKGFAMVAEDVASFFDDIDLGREIKDSLLNSHTPPSEYPNMFISAGYIFLQVIAPELNDEFWKAEPDFQEIKMAVDFMSETGLSLVRGEENTPLVCFMHHQRLARILPRAAHVVKAKGKHNWATIANALADKQKAAEKDITNRVKAYLNQDSAPAGVPALNIPRPK